MTLSIEIHTREWSNQIVCIWISYCGILTIQYTREGSMHPHSLRKENSAVKSMNLSMQLLGNVTHRQPNSKEGLKSLAELSKRIRFANQNHAHDKRSREEANVWIKQGGVNLRQLAELSQQSKKEQCKEPIHESLSSWHHIEFHHLSDLPAQEYQQRFEERIINYSVMLQLSHEKNSLMRRLNTKLMMRLGSCQETMPKRDILQDSGSEITQKVDIYCDIIEKLLLGKSHPLSTNKLDQLYLHFAKQLKSQNVFWMYVTVPQLHALKSISAQLFTSHENYCCYARTNVMVNSVKAIDLLFSKLYEARDLSPCDLVRELYGEEADQFWGEAYFWLRMGNIDKLLLQLDSRNSLRRTMKVDYMQHQKSVENLTPKKCYQVDTNKQDNFFQRQLKNILKGSYERPHPNIVGNIQSLDEPWLILRTIGVYRGETFRAGFDVEELKANQASYWQSVRVYANEHANDHSRDLVVGLLALADYKSIIKILRKERNLFPEEDYLHLLILLYTNPKYIQMVSQEWLTNDSQQLSITASQILSVCRDEIIAYIIQLKRNHKFTSNIYLMLLYYQETHNYKHKLTDSFAFEALVSQITKSLFKNLQDLKLFNFPFLSKVLDDFTAEAEAIQKEIMTAIRPKTYAEHLEVGIYLKKSNFHQQWIRNALQLIIIDFVDQENIARNEYVPNGMMDFVSKLLRPSEDGQLDHLAKQIYDMEQQIGEWLNTNRDHPFFFMGHLLFTFVSDIKKLKSIIRQKKLNQTSSLVQKWRNDFNHQNGQNLQFIYQYLKNLCEDDRQVFYFDIYIKYYECLYQVEQMKCLQTNNLTELKKQKKCLAKELETLKRKYSQVKSPLFGRVYTNLSA